MSYADAIRRQAEDAPRAALPAVAKVLWQAFSAGQVTEAEAEALSALVEIRLTAATGRPGPSQNGCAQSANGGTDTPQDRQSGPRRPGVGSRPRTDASMERRRRWAVAKNTRWQAVVVPGWYGASEQVIEVASDTAVWRHGGMPVVPIRWVLVRDP